MLVVDYWTGNFLGESLFYYCLSSIQLLQLFFVDFEDVHQHRIRLS